MRKLKLIQKFAALVLAFLILTSTTGLAVDAHYCKTNLVSISVWGKAKPCAQAAMQEETNDYSTTTKTPQVSKKSCCSSKNAFNKTDITTDIRLLEKSIEANPVITYFTGFTVHNLPAINCLAIRPQPHIMDKDFSVAYQNFRL